MCDKQRVQGVTRGCTECDKRCTGCGKRVTHGIHRGCTLCDKGCAGCDKGSTGCDKEYHGVTSGVKCDRGCNMV